VVHYLVVLVVANVIAILQAYVFQRRLVFRYTGGWWAGLLRFSTVYLGAFAVNLVLLPALHELAQIPVIPAQAIATVVQAFGTYLAHRLFTFRHPDQKSPDGEDLLPGGDNPG
jgi:putative flippase GtrA